MSDLVMTTRNADSLCGLSSHPFCFGFFASETSVAVTAGARAGHPGRPAGVAGEAAARRIHGRHRQRARCEQRFTVERAGGAEGHVLDGTNPSLSVRSPWKLIKKRN